MKPGLRKEILEHSEADNLRDAVAEWRWTATWLLEEDDEQHCPCDQPIREICEITNRVNGKRLEIGNKCIKLFGCDGADEAAQVCDALRRLRGQATGSPGEALIQYSLDTEVLTPDEAEFLRGLHGRKKSLIDDMDEATRIDLNRKLLREFAPAGLRGFETSAAHWHATQEKVYAERRREAIARQIEEDARERRERKERRERRERRRATSRLAAKLRRAPLREA